MVQFINVKSVSVINATIPYTKEGRGKEDLYTLEELPAVVIVIFRHIDIINTIMGSCRINTCIYTRKNWLLIVVWCHCDGITDSKELIGTEDSR